MRSSWTCAGLAAVVALCFSVPVQAADQEAGVPLSPAEAGGVWTLESAGRDICAVTLGATKSGSGAYLARSDRPCSEVFDGAPIAWQPTADGMQLLGMDGRTLIAFSRWSNSLFVSHRSSGVDVQLRRGQGRAVGAVN